MFICSILVSHVIIEYGMLFAVDFEDAIDDIYAF